jgi:hypothetical protein
MLHYNSIYFAVHVGPFIVYPTAAYAITISTLPDKLTMPKWRNNILVMAPGTPDHDAVTGICDIVIHCNRAILLFRDFSTFKAWQRLLREVVV